MLALSDNLSQSFDALRQHKLRAVLTTIGLTMGVATLITVMTLVQGANVYVEQKIARLGTDVFQIARTPFVVTDFNLVIKALKFKNLYMDDMRAVADGCPDCKLVGASVSGTARTQYHDKELTDISFVGHTPSMADIDSRTVRMGRYFTDSENMRSSYVCLIGDDVAEQLFAGVEPVGQVIKIDNDEFTVVGTMDRIGSVLGQDQDNFAIVPMNTYLRKRGTRSSITIQVKTGAGAAFEKAQDEARLVLRTRRHVLPGAEEDFFIGTKDSYISLWQQISSAFFAVFIMVSSISAVVGGIVIMNVMLVSVTERTKEIGIRRAMGATQDDILRQFLSESVIQCLVGGGVGISIGFLCALALRSFTSFPASVQAWVAILGLLLSSMIGLFFGIYPATRAAKLDPVVALRSD
ncbi:MAG TPA: ABC transporter permease [Bryobacteraceae bacterium]|jgi:putative ABC transport system permease protein|nr:ABC transporter permease [Bryobacteraceae bacterium]